MNKVAPCDESLAVGFTGTTGQRLLQVCIESTADEEEEDEDEEEEEEEEEEAEAGTDKVEEAQEEPPEEEAPLDVVDGFEGLEITLGEEMTKDVILETIMGCILERVQTMKLKEALKSLKALASNIKGEGEVRAKERQPNRLEQLYTEPFAVCQLFNDLKKTRIRVGVMERQTFFDWPAEMFLHSVNLHLEKLAFYTNSLKELGEPVDMTKIVETERRMMPVHRKLAAEEAARQKKRENKEDMKNLAVTVKIGVKMLVMHVMPIPFDLLLGPLELIPLPDLPDIPLPDIDFSLDLPGLPTVTMNLEKLILGIRNLLEKLMLDLCFHDVNLPDALS